MTPPWPSLDGGEEGCFHWSLAQCGGHNTHLGWGNVQENWLDLLQNCQVLPRHDQTGVLLIRRQKPWHPPSGNLRHAKFVVQNVLYSFSGDSNSIIAFWLTNACHPSLCGEHGRCLLGWWLWSDLGSSSRLSVPLWYSVALICTVEKSLNVPNLNVPRAKPVFCRYLKFYPYSWNVSNTTVKCPELFIERGFIWMETMHENVELMHVKLHCCGNAFMVRLLTFQPTLVYKAFPVMQLHSQVKQVIIPND